MTLERMQQRRVFAADESGSTGSSSSPVAFKPAGSSVEILARVLDASAAFLAHPIGVEVPGDELHQEILLPLLPSMLCDKAIHQHWRDQVATGFVARIQMYLDGAGLAPSWQPADFEVHVTASYLAGPDAKALADTLLSEESLREMTSTLMNQVLGIVWQKLPAAKVAPTATTPTVPVPAIARHVEIQPKPITAQDPSAVVPASMEPDIAKSPAGNITTVVRGVRIKPHPIPAMQRLLTAAIKPAWVAARAMRKKQQQGTHALQLTRHHPSVLKLRRSGIL